MANKHQGRFQRQIPFSQHRLPRCPPTKLKRGEEAKYMGMTGNKTKTVCTIGPACQSQAIMERMLLAGMNVARLNFSHGESESHRQVIENLRASAAIGTPVSRCNFPMGFIPITKRNIRKTGGRLPVNF
jgi:hypothetical protein